MPQGRIYQGNGRIYGPSLTAALMDNKPTQATPCITRKFDKEYFKQTGIVRYIDDIKTEEFETKIARNLQTLIRIGKPQAKVETEARREAIKDIVIACYQELQGVSE